MALNIKLDFPEPLNKMLNPIGFAIGNTLSDIWNGVFSDVHLWAATRKAKAEYELKAYKASLQEQLSLIPPEYIKEPKLSIIGPALEASKYYIEEPVIRDMFAKLIASDIDSRKTNQVHHAYVDIIKQMSPLDAHILAEFKNPTYLIKCLIEEYENTDSAYILTDIYLSDTFTEYKPEISISMSNLSRLGLIDIPTRNVNIIPVDEHYEEAINRFNATLLSQSLRREKDNTNSKLKNYSITSYGAYLTEIGASFRTICL
ncbi:DUF4393 domain-containing protein [Veillonella magna]|uniref:DUF4393 domain-containing protein n=1 Tax=Veillonella magna TaxID=464322 RepID=UPI001961D1BF|nr:DUF4393 domain-containing protein [Veillonella magna]MBM6823686.1 DUF4393 domain-containing protein [Veillonella magna]